VGGATEGGGAQGAPAAFISELRGLRLAQLRKRALGAGVSEEAVEGALDADDPKAALVSLVVSRRLEVGAAGNMAAVLSGGGEGALAAVVEVLEHTAEVLAVRLSSSGRKLRKGLLELLDRVESACESIDTAWCNGVAGCGGLEVEALGSLFSRVSEAGDGTSMEELVLLVSELLESLVECGSVAVQAVSAIGRALVGPAGDDARVVAFEMLRGLSPARQASASSKEVMAAELVISFLVPESRAAVGCQLRESGCMALFVLGGRNGFAVCDEGLVVTTGVMLKKASRSLLKSMSADSPSDSDVLDEIAAGSALMHMFNLVMDASHKLPPAMRGPMEKRVIEDLLLSSMGSFSNGYTAEKLVRCIALMMDHRLLEADANSLACGLPGLLHFLWYTHVDVMTTAIEMGVFSANWNLFGRVFPEPLTAKWLSETRAAPDTQSAKMICLLLGVQTVRAVPGRLSALSVFLCKSVVYGTFVWARRALNSRKRRSPARAGEEAVSRSGGRVRADVGVVGATARGGDAHRQGERVRGAVGWRNDVELDLHLLHADRGGV
jgi:hypothetical protein